MIDRCKYELAKINGVLEKFRGDEISRRISKQCPLSAQIALLMDKDEKPQEWEIYQEFRANVKAEVDEEIRNLEAELAAH